MLIFMIWALNRKTDDIVFYKRIQGKLNMLFSSFLAGDLWKSIKYAVLGMLKMKISLSTKKFFKLKKIEHFPIVGDLCHHWFIEQMDTKWSWLKVSIFQNSDCYLSSFHILSLFFLHIFFSFLKGIPTVFSWEHIEQFDGKKWVDAPFRLNESRSAFAVTTVPGHLVRGCK